VPEIVDDCARLVHLSRDVDELAAQVREDIGETGRVLARSRQAVDQTHGDGVSDAEEDDRNGRRPALHCHRGGRAARNQQLGAALHHLCHRPIEITFNPDDVEHDVPVLN
jgi:hypothetical protein